MFAAACALVHDGGGHANRSCSSTRIARRFRTVRSFDRAASKTRCRNPPEGPKGFRKPLFRGGSPRPPCQDILLKFCPVGQQFNTIASARLSGVRCVRCPVLRNAHWSVPEGTPSLGHPWLPWIVSTGVLDACLPRVCVRTLTATYAAVRHASHDSHRPLYPPRG